jgi:energy-coupling factor transporter ATP-binding protein EcfA2
MIEQVMIYEVKNAASVNAQELFSNDSQYFYWNETKFKNLSIGDFVFVVNRTSKWVLFTQLNKIDISTKEKGDTTIFSDLNKDFNVSGKWNKFIRLEILKKLEMPNNWQWQSLGSSETTYLNGSRIGLDSAVNRIKNIDQLKQLTEDETISQILENCQLNFNGSKLTPVKVKPIQKTKPNTQSEMDILTAIKTKPFILLAGISGTGKSRLVRTLAYKTCNKTELSKDPKKPGNFELIPVRPNWHDSSELMGYVSRINGEKYITTSFLQFIAKAWKNIEIPFFLCLDEMNLAPVEQYFAEYLSIIETRQVQNNLIVTDFLISKSSFENQALYVQLMQDLGLNDNPTFFDGISIPNNLVIIGTVNMDETTHSFSRKVLDRAMTFEMNNVDLTDGLDNTKDDWGYPQEFIKSKEITGEFTSGAEVINMYSESKKVVDFLLNINIELEGTPFKIAYRVRDEFLIYCYYASLNSTDTSWLLNALDEMTSMKILSRIEGDETKTGSALSNLQRVLTKEYKKSSAKLKEMETRLKTSGYTSFWS